MSEPTVTRLPEPDGATRTASGVAPGAPTDDPPAAPPGYELHDLVGSGGMGTVYRAHDLSLSRDVAIKFLHARYSPGSVTAWRFAEEARITARLAHPGIPPVHQVGTAPDGRPFLAMKLIKGQTLDDQLKARKSPADERGRFVGIFEKVADAVGFAHAQRIIHRDLKPANVMVGDFGEVQVMDWGLAKELTDARPAEARPADETSNLEPRPGRDSAGTTQAGSLLGTPAFMPPEQALGAIDLITERADVFGLGAILCVILTGQPPFVSESAESTRVIAARGKLDDCFARLDACGAEPELIALAKRCLSTEPKDRPANAGEVASAVAQFRADAERRARQAETDRATAEVKATEERKRRYVQRVLALTLLGLLAVAGGAGWWIDSERKARRAEQQADELKRVAAAQERVADLKARRLITERDVTAALNEVAAISVEGLKHSNDPARWAVTLGAARNALKRAEGLLAAGEPTAELRDAIALAARRLEQDERDRALIAEFDRLTEENDVQFLIPVGFSRKPSGRYAAAFRAHGIDLVTATHDEAVAWLKTHPFRQRLTTAVRKWQMALPSVDPPVLLNPGGPQADAALAAVGGEVGAVAVQRRQTLRERLQTIADAASDDPFTRKWWAAVRAKDRDALKGLLAQPELGRLSSSELESLAEGLSDLTRRNDELMTELLRAAYERFPGDFWVNFRLAEQMSGGRPGGIEPTPRATRIRHLNAAVAARPRSVIARIALASELLEQNKKDPTAIRIVRGAAELDPTSPWPHILLGFLAMETGNWVDLRASLAQAVRADPDTAFLMIASLFPAVPFGAGARVPIPLPEVDRLIESLIAAAPDHPGGYQLRGGYRFNRHDYRGALADYREAKVRPRPDFLFGALTQVQLDYLEHLAPWEEKLPAVLRGELKPTAAELANLAEYCAGFERKYALAARFAGEALTANPKLYLASTTVVKFAGWSVRAGRGEGADAADLTSLQRAGLRQQALAWLREAASRPDAKPVSTVVLQYNRDLAPMRDPEELAKLPPEERIAWEKFWRQVGASVPSVKPGPREVAPPPREAKREDNPPP